MTIQTKPEPFCPNCGGRMILRVPKPKQSWKPFWGCSQYPDCEGSRNIREDGKPESDDDIIGGFYQGYDPYEFKD